MAKIDIALLRKKPLLNPKAEDVINEFSKYLDYADERQQILTPKGWRNFLNITDATYHNWKTAGKNIGLNEEEFNDRVSALKKIDDALEQTMGDDMLAAKYPTGYIFYLKNAFKWRDKSADDDKTISVQIGTIAPKKRRDQDKK